MRPPVIIHQSRYGGTDRNFHVTKRGDQLDVELTYPPRSDADNTNEEVRYVCVDQESVRASDGIRLHYDYERDGWVIEQASVFSWDSEEASNAPNAEDWQEVAFIKSWARQKEEDR